MEEKKKITKTKKVLYALSTALLCILMLEALFRVFGLFAPPKPFTEFESGGIRFIRFNLSPTKQEFRKDKPMGVFRIMVFGGSTSMGFPYHPRSSFGLRLGTMIESALPGQVVEVVNLASMGMHSGGVLDVMDGSLEYDPDLIIIYSGHNEFIQLTSYPISAGAWKLVSRIRVARAMADAIALVAGGAMLTFMQAMEQEQAIELPEPAAITPDQYAEVNNSFEHNMISIAARSRKQKVPVVLMTLSSNIRDWPPETRELTLENAATLNDYKNILEEDAKRSVSHRAPPKINRVIRKVAENEGIFLVDTERLFESNADSAPGFDMFVDHCHPDMEAQQMIANALFELLRQQGIPSPSGKWRTDMEWNEESFRKSQGINDDFLHGIYLRLGIFLGLQKDLPDRSRATRETLALASSLNPDDTLSVVAGAVVAVHYGDTAETRELLSTWAKQNPEKLDQCLNRYFTSKIRHRDCKLMAHTNQQQGMPPLMGLMKSGLFKNEEDQTGIPAPADLKDDYNYILDLGCKNQPSEGEP